MSELDAEVPESKRLHHKPEKKTEPRATITSNASTATTSEQQHDPIETVSSLCGIKGLLLGPDDEGNTPVHFASRVGATTSFSYLLKRAPDDLNKQDRDGNTPLGIALLHKQPNFAITVIQKGPNIHKPVHLVKRKDDVECKRTTHSGFYEAISNGWQGVAYLLLDAGYAFADAIQDAIVSQKFQLVLTLLSKILAEDTVICDGEGHSLLHYVAKSERNCDFDTRFAVKIARCLVERKVDPKKRALTLRTALHDAAVGQHTTLITYLLSLGVSVTEIDNEGQTPFSLFVQQPRPSMPLCRLLIQSKSDIDRIFPEIFNKKGKREPPSDKKDKEKEVVTTTALIRAVQTKNRMLLMTLLRNGASLTKADHNGRTPLMHAVVANALEIAQLLLAVAKGERPTASWMAWAKKAQEDYTETDAKKGNNDEDEENDEEEGEEEKEDKIEEKEEDEDEGDDDDDDDDNEGDEDEDEDGEAKSKKRAKTASEQKEQKEEKKEQKEQKEPSIDWPARTPVDIVHAVDKNKKSLVHLVVNPLSFGSYESVEMLKLLAAAGAPLELPDAVGNPPMAYAQTQESGVMKKCLHSLGAKEAPPTLRRQQSGIYEWPVREVDYEYDAQEMLKKLQAEGSEHKKHNPPKVNINIDAANKTVVPFGTTSGVYEFYDTLLTKVDLEHGSFGLNVFYKMQVVEDKVSGLFILVNNWGRIGERGKFQQTPFAKKEEAVLEFQKVFRSKTGNVWGQPFVKAAKKYGLVVKDRWEFSNKQWLKSLLPRSLEQKQREQGLLKDHAKSLLAPEMQDTLHFITDVAMMNEVVKKSGIDLPLGRLSRETLEKASSALQTIKGALERVKELRKATPPDPAAIRVEMEAIAEQSTLFYELIPHTEYTSEPIRPISEADLGKKSDLVTSLMDLEVATKVVLGAQLRPSVMHPLDYCYKAIDASLEVLDPADPEFRAIRKYAAASGGDSSSAHVERVYRLQRMGEAENMRKWRDIGNHRLLWHGTRAANVVGILKQGLRVAPVEAPSTGYMFGKGVYFADAFQKSLGYCGGVGGEQRGFMLLCEVALGVMNPLREADYMEKAKEGTHSTQGVGKQGPDSAGLLTLENGVCVPLGVFKQTPIPGSGYDWFVTGRWGRQEPFFTRKPGQLEELVAGGLFPCRCDIEDKAGLWHTVTLHAKDKGSVVAKVPGESAPPTILATAQPGAVTIVRKKLQASTYYTLNYNEYIVYDPTQVRIRYLVQLKGGKTSKDEDEDEE